MTVDPFRRDALQPAWLMFIASTPAVRVWTGVANFKLGAASGPDVAGGVYQGLGVLVGAPQLKIPLNGTFAQHVFSLSGVDERALRLANADRDTVRQARIAFAVMPCDGMGQPTQAPIWLWVGQVDGPRLVRDGSTDPVSRTVGLIASAGAFRRKWRQRAYWTPAQQAAVDPLDTSCDQVPLYASGTDTIWPN